MLTAARAEARELMRGLPTMRTPQLRRALPDDWMLATDLPQLTDADTLRAFRRLAEAWGWRVSGEGGWLMLDKPDLLALPAFPEQPPGGEKGCVLSLLRRHPEWSGDTLALRLMARASELPGPAAEALYLRIHRRWAEALRDGVNTGYTEKEKGDEAGC